jgi:hypothetical protein
MAAQADPLKVNVTYLGQGHFLFKKQTYDHTGLVQAVQAAYVGQPIDLVSVVVPAGTTLLDRRDICRLRVELQTQVKMHLVVGDGTTQPQFCN